MDKRLKLYIQSRKKMDTGDVIAFHGHDPGSFAIRLATGSKYNHVGLAVKVNNIDRDIEGKDVDRIFIAESNKKTGVVLWPLSRKLINYDGKAWWFPLNIKRKTEDYPLCVIKEGVRERIYKWAMLELGIPFDMKLIFKIARSLITKKKITEENYQEYICSEYVARALREVGLLPEGKTTNLTPQSITALPTLVKKPHRIL